MTDITAKLASVLEWMVELCQRSNPGAFSNGVTDSTGSIDEGDVIASRIMGEARDALTAYTASQGTRDDETVDRVAAAINAARYASPEHARTAPPFADEDARSQEYAYRLARAALSAIPARDDGWMPIETAPKDGTRVLAYPVTFMEAGVVSWHADQPKRPHLQTVSDIAHGPAAYWRVLLTMDKAPYQPTHWRPLPAPPAPAQEPR